MNRIRNNNSAPTHPKTNHWLSKFVIELKKMVYKTEGDNYQPFTMARLEEWAEHRKSLEECWDFESAMIKHVNLYDNPIYEHAGAIMFFNGLVIDLKLMVMGHEYTPFTEDRISEIDKHFYEIHRCCKNVRINY